MANIDSIPNKISNFLSSIYGIPFVITTSLTIAVCAFYIGKKYRSQKIDSTPPPKDNKFSIDIGDYAWYPSDKNLVHQPRNNSQQKSSLTNKYNNETDEEIVEQLIYETLNAGFLEESITNSESHSESHSLSNLKSPRSIDSNRSRKKHKIKHKSKLNGSDFDNGSIDNDLSNEVSAIYSRRNSLGKFDRKLIKESNEVETFSSHLNNKNKHNKENTLLKSVTSFNTEEISFYTISSNNNEVTNPDEEAIQEIVVEALNSSIEDEIVRSYEALKKSKNVNIKNISDLCLEGISEDNEHVIFSIDHGEIKIRKYLLFNGLIPIISEYPFSKKNNTIYLHNLGIEIACGDKTYLNLEKETVRFGMKCYEAQYQDRFIAIWIQSESVIRESSVEKEIISDVLKSFKASSQQYEKIEQNEQIGS